MPTTPKNDKRETPTVRLTTFLATIIPCIVAILFLGTLLTISIGSNFSKEENTTNSTQPTDNNSSSNSNSTSTEEQEWAALFAAFQHIDSQDVLDLLSSGDTGFLYIGRPTCPHCRAFAPLLTDAAASLSVDILYYDTDASHSEGDLRSQVLSAFDISGVPAFFFVKDGAIIEKLSNTTNSDTIHNFLAKYRS